MSSKPKVIKITCEDGHLGDQIITLFENGKIRAEPIECRKLTWADMGNTPEKEARQEIVLSDQVHVQIGNSVFQRECKLACRERERKIVKIEPRKFTNHEIELSLDKIEGKRDKYVTFLIEKQDFAGDLLTYKKKIESKFNLTEHELIQEAHKIIKGQYSWVHFRNHVEIDGRITDGLAFVGSTKDHNGKIMGFEAKADTDNYERLYRQLDSYLTICDEVYLIVESKEPPTDLPFYVGIIKVKDGIGETVRAATSLKHSIDVGECWKTLLKGMNAHLNLKRNTDTISFFNAVENIKRKLIWNQFVIGYHQTWVQEYVPLTDAERRLVKSYFGVECQSAIFGQETLKEAEPKKEVVEIAKAGQKTLC
jgi:hypothetical protein